MGNGKKKFGLLIGDCGLGGTKTNDVFRIQSGDGDHRPYRVKTGDGSGNEHAALQNWREVEGGRIREIRIAD